MYINILRKIKNDTNGEHTNGCHMSKHIRVWGGCGYKMAARGSSDTLIVPINLNQCFKNHKPVCFFKVNFTVY